MTVQGLVFALVGGLQCTTAIRSQVDLWSEALHSDLESESPTHYGIDREWSYGGYLRVNFTAEPNDAPSSFTIHGEDAEHEVTWSFYGRRVRRSSKPARSEEAWGLLDQPLAGETFVDFERTHEKWEVSINGKRTPWFDYEEFTHWTVRRVSWSNVNLPKLSLFYRECNTACATAECKSCEHDGVPSATSACRAISATGARQCETQPTAQAQCCRGDAAPPRFASLRPGNWVYMTSNDDLIKSGCPAFENDANKCMNLKGRTMRVLKTDSSTRKVELWVPDLPTEQNPVFVPVFLLEPKASVYKTIVIKNQEGAAEGVQVNNENQYIWDVRSKAKLLKVPKHWYIHRINNQPFTPARWSASQGARNQFTITVVDTESNIFDSCQDQSGWKDSDGDGCAEYKKGEWCNKRGEVTEKFKGKTCRRFLFFSCEFTMEDKRPKDHGGNIATNACCACGGGYFKGDAPTPALTEPVTEAPTAAPPTEAPPLVVPSPKAPKEVFLVGADSGYPEHMGHFELRVDKADETMGKAVYVNVHHHMLFWSIATQKWTIKPESGPIMEAGETSVGDTPYEAVPEDGSLADWKIGGSKVDLSASKSYSCGEKSDCNCPELDYECKATAQDLYCYPGQIMQPKCGTLDACCEKKPTCAESGDWSSCFAYVGPKTGINYCPLSGCEQEHCCGKTCLAECSIRGLEVNQTNKAAVCPDEGCNRDFCCEQSDAPAPPSNPGENKQDLITCEECVTDDETQRQVLQAQVTVAGLSYQKMVENYVVRSAVYDSVRKATLESMPDAGLTEKQIVIHVSPGGNAVQLKILLLPPVESLHKIKASIMDANKTGTWKVNFEENLKQVPNIMAIAEDQVREDEIDAVMPYEPQVKTAIHNRRLQQDIDSRGSRGSIWGSHATAKFGVWGEFIVQHWYFFAAGAAVVGGVSFMAMRWLGNDDEDADVIG